MRGHGKQNPRDEELTVEYTHFGFRKVPVPEKVRWVAAHFDAVAKRYDFSNTVLSFGMHHLWKKKAIRMMALREGMNVLDLCGGTGDLAILAAKEIGPAGCLFLYDINWKMMLEGRAKISGTGLENRIRFVQGDAEYLAFPDASFDAVMVGFGIRNVTDMKKGFAEMHRVLKPGGILMCLEFSRPVTPWFRFLYDFYSFTVMPLLGRLLTGSAQAYLYLPESIRLFPLQDDLTSILERIGFQKVKYCNLTNGIAVVHTGVKQP